MSKPTSKTAEKAAPRHFVKQWRKAGDLSQERLAELAGLTHGAISQLERGLIKYTQDTIEKLAEVFGCQPADIISGPPSAGPQRALVARFREALEIFEGLSPLRQARILGAIEDAARAEGLPAPPLGPPDRDAQTPE